MEVTDSVFTGLSQKEAAQRQAAGQSNRAPADMTKSTKTIILQNTLTLFNFLNFALAAALFAVGAYANAFFITIILFNILLGIVQELRAKKMVSQLTLLSEKKVTVIREGSPFQLSPQALVLGDVVKLTNGEQVPSDLTVLTGEAEVNESLLTGEADAIFKKTGDPLLSGSYLTSGELIGRVEHVGNDNYATRIVAEAKTEKAVKSELVASIAKISTFTSWVILPIGTILFIEALFFQQDSLTTAVVSSVAALIGMLPKGLVLLIGLALTTGVLKLAKKDVLVQNKYAIEMLAHMDVLALDKTGTLTAGDMQVEQVYLLEDSWRDRLFDLVGSYLSATSDNNLTAQALQRHFPKSRAYTPEKVLPFSSERKWAAVVFEQIGTLYLGAPEKLLSSAALPEILDQNQAAGKRVLLLALDRDSRTHCPDDLQPLALITLVDPLRENVSQTLSYLKKQGVALKVISGDNPLTVAAIAQAAGVENSNHNIDLSTLQTEAAIREAAHRYTVFGRVTPQQKKLLVNELKAAGQTVGMTGDGVNDILALREADISIAMGEGDGATRQIADIVLLDSDLGQLPAVIAEGRRVINNITQSSGVFFIKTIYSFLLSLFCIFSATAFPFIPLQITLIDLAIEGYPSFFASFSENDRPVTGHFLQTALRRALPSALLVVANIICCWLLAQLGILTIPESRTLMYALLIGISGIGLVNALRPFTAFRIFLAVTAVFGSFAAVLLFHRLLMVAPIGPIALLLFAALMLLNLACWQPLFNKTRNWSLALFTVKN